MLEKFYPDYIFDSVFDISIDFLKSIDVKGIIFDIDNTLEPYENSDPSIETLSWLDLIADAGISASIVSNNNKVRVNTFNRTLGYPAYSMAMKPFKRDILKAIKEMGTDARNTVFIGDQMLTDVLGAHRAGIKAILVQPIKDKKGLFTRFKRKIERYIIKRVEKRMSKI